MDKIEELQKQLRGISKLIDNIDETAARRKNNLYQKASAIKKDINKIKLERLKSYTEELLSQRYYKVVEGNYGAYHLLIEFSSGLYKTITVIYHARGYHSIDEINLPFDNSDNLIAIDKQEFMEAFDKASIHLQDRISNLLDK